MGFSLKMISENKNGKKYVSAKQPTRLFSSFEKAKDEAERKIKLSKEMYLGNYCDFSIEEVSSNPCIEGQSFVFPKNIEWM